MVNPKNVNRKNSVKKKPIKINTPLYSINEIKSVPSFMGGTEKIIRRKINTPLIFFKGVFI
jgi:hypothetical protein